LLTRSKLDSGYSGDVQAKVTCFRGVNRDRLQRKSIGVLRYLAMCMLPQLSSPGFQHALGVDVHICGIDHCEFQHVTLS
jgi:hypothetical protein